MPTPVDRAPHTDAILGVLETAGYRIGDGQAPEDNTLPYAVLYPLVASTNGTLDNPDEDLAYECQISLVGKTRPQVENLADEIRDTIMNTPLVIAGRSVFRIQPVYGAVRPDDDVQPPLFFIPDRYLIWTVPT